MIPTYKGTQDKHLRLGYLVFLQSRFGQYGSREGRRLMLQMPTGEMKLASRLTPEERHHYMEHVFQCIKNPAPMLRAEMETAHVGGPLYDYCKTALTMVSTN